MISKRYAGPAAVLLATALAACGQDGGTGEGPAAAADAVAPEQVAARRLAVLEQRRALVSDARQIKRLQRLYGYYLDQGRYGDIAGLFAADGTLEIGLDGVYAGRDRVRAYLEAYGGGVPGPAAGRLSVHMQLMPVVTVAPDGRSAKGRWRDLMLLGRFGGPAWWGEGPFENEYVKEDGVWKISKLHWYQSMLVPYATGWQATSDANGGHWVSPELTPDRPPSVDYETWPAVYLPPFHFPNPVLGAEPVSLPEPDAAPGSAATLTVRAAELERAIARLEDQDEIEKLQRIYGFYIDKQLWTEAASLFADDGTIEFGDSGVYVGRDRIHALLASWGAEGPQNDVLFDRMQLQPIVDVADDGLTASGRWRLFAQEAHHGEYAHWGTGIYENTYVKVDGKWRIRSLHAYPTMVTTYEGGWSEVALPDPGPSQTLPPDRPPSTAHPRYPDRHTVPLHAGLAVSAESVSGGERPGRPATAAVAPGSAASTSGGETLTAMLDRLEARLVRLEDMTALERLNAIYGYYLARNQWDEFTGIFAPDGTIEIAMRGVYEGRPDIRRSMNLYGEPGVQHGLLHNHMQYQPVIDIADDGASALMRSRAFSIMGQWEAYSMWMGGVYENVYVKRDGIWQIEKDQVFNTYFVPYAVGWKDVAPRPPPQISATNPPDAPPTHPFEMYPTAFLPPFHYPNPVTGRLVVWEQNR